MKCNPRPQVKWEYYGRYYYKGPGRGRGLSRGGSELGGMKPGPTTLLGASIVSGYGSIISCCCCCLSVCWMDEWDINI